MGAKTSHVISTNNSKEDRDFIFPSEDDKSSSCYSMFSNITCVWISTGREDSIYFSYSFYFALYIIPKALSCT